LLQGDGLVASLHGFASDYLASAELQAKSLEKALDAGLSSG
jgi:hypothetical protein